MLHALPNITRASLAAALVIPAVAQAAFTVIGPKQIIDPSTSLEWVATSDPTTFAAQGFRLANTAEVRTLITSSGFASAPDSTSFGKVPAPYNVTAATMGLKIAGSGGCSNTGTCYSFGLFASDTDNPNVLQATTVNSNSSSVSDWYVEFKPASEGMYSHTSALSGLYKDSTGTWKVVNYKDAYSTFYGAPVDSLMVRAAAVPEPGTWLTMLAGLGVLPLVIRRMKKRAY